MSVTVEQLCGFLDRFAPRRLAEEWDNVGLLVGRRDRELSRVMTCLTVTPASAAEAVMRGAEAIVTHHPLPFRPLKRLTPDNLPGRLLLTLVESRIAVISPHTAFDSAAEGINQRLATGLGLASPRPLSPIEEDPEGLGAGRFGDLPAPISLAELGIAVGRLLGVGGLHRVGGASTSVRRVACACGSGGSFLAAARRQGCDVLVTGEATFHTCLEAESDGIGMLLPGHFASERFALEVLATEIHAEFPELEVWASARETDPLSWMETTSANGD
ncbi:MAG: Nif3-like dinuclear metal center hexameric protein [Planctomycetales bacterium]|nr:Nif3-like dinuclear metal center hexameric protein [Planctomycetales bacterium]